MLYACTCQNKIPYFECCPPFCTLSLLVNKVYHAHLGAVMSIEKDFVLVIYAIQIMSFREGFRSRLESIVRGQVSSHPETTSINGTSAPHEFQHENEETDSQLSPEHYMNLESSIVVQNQQVSSDIGSDWQRHVTEVERESHQQSADIESNEWAHSASEGTDSNWQETTVPAWPEEALSPENQGENNLQEATEAWRDVGSGETAENWSEGGPADPPRLMRSVTSTRGARFHPPDDDNVYSMELRELLSR